jgi:TatD DNase family protein
MWTDSHCHLDYEGMESGAIADARLAGVTRIITVGTDAEVSSTAIATARNEDGIWATVGLHPHEASSGVHTIRGLLDPPDPVVVGVGECGLDYFYDHSDREDQRRAFAEQIALASALDLTLVVHTRDAWDDTFEILSSEGVPSRLVMHCFTGGPAEARRALDLGAYLSFSGIVTFKTAHEIRESASLCPPDRLLVETDSPYLAPVPHRGRPNGPKWVPLVGSAVAESRGVPVAMVEGQTWDNASDAFRLDAQ